MPVDQPVSAAQIPVEDEVFAQQANGLDRIAVELAGTGDRLPIATQQLAHRGAGSDAGEHFVAGGGEQAFLRLNAFGSDYFTSRRRSGGDKTQPYQACDVTLSAASIGRAAAGPTADRAQIRSN